MIGSVWANDSKWGKKKVQKKNKLVASNLLANERNIFKVMLLQCKTIIADDKLAVRSFTIDGAQPFYG